MKLLSLSIIMAITSGCAIQQPINKVDDIANAKIYIQNGVDTLYWVYCGKTDKDEIILKRVDGTLDVLGFGPSPVVKIRGNSWYLINSDIAELNDDINPGTRLLMISSEEPLANLRESHFDFITDLKLADREFSKFDMTLIDATE